MSWADDKVQDLVATQAAEWFVAHRDGELSATQRMEFVDWLQQSPLHVAEYLAASQAAHDLVELTNAAAFSEYAQQVTRMAEGSGGAKIVMLREALPSQAARTPTTPRWQRLAAACVAIALMVVSWQWLTRTTTTEAKFATYATLRGEQRSIVLADGSLLYLNSDSAIKVRYLPGSRELRLERGQAFFKVAHDTSRPFRVLTGSVAAIAVGTEFDVYRRGNDTLVTVLEGKVRVAASAAPNAPASNAVRSSRVVEIHAGERAQVDRALQMQVTPVNADNATAWTRHQIAFDRESLANVAGEFNRYSAVTVEIEDARLRELRVSGVLDAYDLVSFVEFLRRLADVEVITTPNHRVLVRQRPLQAAASNAS